MYWLPSVARHWQNFKLAGYTSSWLRSLELTNCGGIDDVRLELITDTLNDSARFELMIQRAGEPGRDFGA